MTDSEPPSDDEYASYDEEGTTRVLDDDARKLDRYQEYALTPFAELFSEFAGVYLAETMSSPATIAGSRWTCTALPRTGGGGRYYTINAGGLEVLFTYVDQLPSGEIRPWIMMNVELPQERNPDDLVISTPVCKAAPSTGYKREKVWSWHIDLRALCDDQDAGHHELGEVFSTRLDSGNELFELGRALNQRLMEHSRSMWTSSHNKYLAGDFLSRGSDD